MRIIIDECLPRQLISWLGEKHESTSVQKMGWTEIKNGKLLKAADQEKFDVLLTSDKNMYFQNNFTNLQISTIVLPGNRKSMVQQCVGPLLQSLEHIKPGQKVVMELGLDRDKWEFMQFHSIQEESEHVTHKFYLPDS